MAFENSTEVNELQDRYVLIGASNVARGMPCILSYLERQTPQPIDIMVAHGHGRSYGKASRVAIRTLPGIVECGLWDDLSDRPNLPTKALITDIGNDILYDQPAEQIVAWVETCVDQLANIGANIAMTALPMEGLRRLPKGAYYAMRTMLYPGCRVSFDVAQERSEQLYAGIVSLAQRRGLSLFHPPPNWYGVDPIHIRRSESGHAWPQILGAFSADPASSNVKSPYSWAKAVMLATRVPHSRKLAFIKQSAQQPTYRFKNGSRLSLY